MNNAQHNFYVYRKPSIWIPQTRLYKPSKRKQMNKLLTGTSESFHLGNKWGLTYKVSGFIPATNISWWQTRKQSVQNNLHFLFDKEYVLVQSRLITNLHKNGL